MSCKNKRHDKEEGVEEKREVEEETLSVHMSPKRGAQSSSETSEPKKPRLSEERALLEAKFAVSPVAAIEPSSPPRRQGPFGQEGEERAGEMSPPRDAHRELADVRRQLEDAKAQRRAALENVGRLERERDSAETARQAAVEESARLVAQLEELRRGKAASDAAAQESALTVSDLWVWVQMLKRVKADDEAARRSSEWERQVAEAELIGCEEFICGLERQLFWSMEERSKLEAELRAMSQRVMIFARMALDL